MLASQMAEAIVETTTYRFTPEQHKNEEWISKGEVIIFPGFMKLYIEGTDDEENEESRKLPLLEKGKVVKDIQTSDDTLKELEAYFAV